MDAVAHFFWGLLICAPAQSPTSHGQIDHVRIFGTSTLSGFGLGQSPVQTAGQSRHHFILQLEKVGHVLFETVGPQMCASLGIYELRVDAHPVLVALDRAFEHVAHAKLLADLLGVDFLPL